MPNKITKKKLAKLCMHIRNRFSGMIQKNDPSLMGCILKGFDGSKECKKCNGVIVGGCPAGEPFLSIIQSGKLPLKGDE